LKKIEDVARTLRATRYGQDLSFAASPVAAAALDRSRTDRTRHARSAARAL